MYSTEPKNSFWQNYSVMLKMILVAILVLVLLIPTFMIRGLINERKYNQQEVINEVASKWGREQVISGPVISVPFTLNKANQASVLQYAHFLPESYQVSGHLNSTYRKRNIFKVIGYEAGFVISGEFKKPDLNSFGQQVKSAMDTSGVIVQWPITDLKGIKNRIVLEIDGQSMEMNPGLTVQDLGSSGLWCRISLHEIFKNKNSVSYRIHLEKLNGTQRISFLPIGKETTVNLTSNWASPSFDGNFLPDTRKVKKSGFVANWKILNLNRNFPQQFTSSNSELNASAFGVSLIQPVDHYLLSERSAKYAILFISLTFLTFFFCEITNNRKIHPIQYILIGLAIVLFFSLLLSLSEQIGFDLAYLAASLGIISMIVIYAQSILRNLKLTLIIGGVLAMLYGFIYIILQLENLALLFGSLGLFVILALVMFVSRKIDWYNVSQRAEEKP